MTENELEAKIRYCARQIEQSLDEKTKNRQWKLRHRLLMRRWRNAINKRTPDVWKQLILSAPRKLVRPLACMVWWDFFADKKGVRDAWKSLISGYHARDWLWDEEEMAREFVRLGFPRDRAEERAVHQGEGYTRCMTS